MKVLDIAGLPKTVPPKHYGIQAREIWGPATGGHKMGVLHNEMEARGGAEMHAHRDSEHVFVVLRGELQVTDGREWRVVAAGQALVVEPGEPTR